MPAFMQPPAKDWSQYDQKDLFWSPDSLDILDTAKNHDLKMSVAVGANIESWIFALITMQTMNGQVGRGNYPIARMNSGDGSRTGFSVTPFLSAGGHTRRDTNVLLARSPEIMEELPFNWDGLGLLWTRQWNGEREKLPLRTLHPFFIEVCRRPPSGNQFRWLSVCDESWKRWSVNRCGRQSRCCRRPMDACQPDRQEGAQVFGPCNLAVSAIRKLPSI